MKKEEAKYFYNIIESIQYDSNAFTVWYIELLEGNYAYVKEFRDKMTHRASPNISSSSSYAMELRLPMIYVLKRVAVNVIHF